MIICILKSSISSIHLIQPIVCWANKIVSNLYYISKISLNFLRFTHVEKYHCFELYIAWSNRWVILWKKITWLPVWCCAVHLRTSMAAEGLLVFLKQQLVQHVVHLLVAKTQRLGVANWLVGESLDCVDFFCMGVLHYKIGGQVRHPLNPEEEVKTAS